jgi:prolyl-tRNA synthetase
MRAREFIMKDAYSFHIDEKCLDSWYENYKHAYNNIFKKLQLDYTMVDADSGNIGGNKSNEFHVLAETGEDDLLIDDNGIGINFEIAKTKYKSDDIKKIISENSLIHKKGIEVGHIFKLGDKYSKSMGLAIADADLKQNHLQMGCYGIGVSRIIAASIEQNHDDNGIIWPKNLTPFKIVLVEIDGHKNESVKSYSSELYQVIQKSGIEIILDDRNSKLGNKLHDWELMGIPNVVIIGKNEASSNIVTFKQRGSSEKESLNIEQLMSKITTN